MKKHCNYLGFPGNSDGKVPAYNAGDWIRCPGREDPLEKEMAIYYSTLAWKIPLMEEPGRLQSMGSQRVKHDWANSLVHNYYAVQQIRKIFIKAYFKKFGTLKFDSIF